MTLSDMTEKQLNRLYRRVYRTLPYGGCFGWDVHTIKLTYPHKWKLLQSIAREHDQKLRERIYTVTDR